MPYARDKRIVFWSSLIITAGTTVGTYFFPPLFPLPLTALIVLMGSYYSLESELQRKISHYEKPIDLQELINSPDTNPSSNKNKAQKNYKDRSEERTDLSDKAWAEYIIFDQGLKKAKEKPNDFSREEDLTSGSNLNDSPIDNKTSHSFSDTKDVKTEYKP